MDSMSEKVSEVTIFFPDAEKMKLEHGGISKSKLLPVNHGFLDFTQKKVNNILQTRPMNP